MSRITPDDVTELSGCEIFVFGSNLEGQHHGGAARTAYEKFGAEWGVGSGPTGQCYAIPTMHGGLDDIKPYVDGFIEYVRNHPNNRFLVTRVGCGIAGFTDKQMAPLFEEAWRLPNVNVPKTWVLEFDKDKFADAWFGIIPKEKVIPVPDVLTESALKRLCEEYKYIIGSAVIVPKPKIQIRYVLDTNKFGYASFGDFFMCEDGELYVWAYDRDHKLPHHQDMVEQIFGDECKWRRRRKWSFLRVIFAGVSTGVKDSNGEMIYTGDVIHIGEDGYDFALGTMFNGTEYAFLLDNHALRLSDCKGKSLRRIGTVFYQLDRNETPVPTLNERTMRFQGWRDTTEEKELKKLMARFTPNFEQEEWKYEALEIIGAEYHWNK